MFKIILEKKNKAVKKTRKQQIEFSKKIFYMITAFTAIVCIYSMFLMWHTQDSSALSYLIPCVFTEMSVATGFYYWKARKENELKLNKKYKSSTENIKTESEDNNDLDN